MSTVRVGTKALVGLLSDLAHTAASEPEAGAIAGVLLHTTRGHIGADPGLCTLLAGTSTTGYMVGHSHTLATGDARPMLWPINEVRAVIAILKPLCKGENKEHAVEIRRVEDTVTVAEDPDLFGERMQLSFTVGDLDHFPRMVWSAMTDVHLSPDYTDAEGASIPPQPRTDLAPSVLAPFLAVAKRRKEGLQLFRYHQRRPILVQIGATYRGMLATDRYERTDDAIEPSADVHAPDLPPPPRKPGPKVVDLSTGKGAVKHPPTWPFDKAEGQPPDGVLDAE